MPSPFPGMDPYLESPQWFPSLHVFLISGVAQMLQQLLPASYYALPEERLWVETVSRPIIPDGVVLQHASAHDAPSRERPTATATVAPTKPVIVEIPADERREHYVTIMHTESAGDRIVTTIEVLSPSNKTPGERARDLYIRKQREVLDSDIHMVEIDLLRAGEHTTAVPLEWARAKAGGFDYHAVVNRAGQRLRFELYPIALRERLPAIAIPLLSDDGDVTLDLQTVFGVAYDGGPYSRRLDYTRAEIDPPLRDADVAWAQALTAG